MRIALALVGMAVLVAPAAGASIHVVVHTPEDPALAGAPATPSVRGSYSLSAECVGASTSGGASVSTSCQPAVQRDA